MRFSICRNFCRSICVAPAPATNASVLVARKVFTTALVATALVASGLSVAAAQAQECIIDEQVVSDTVIGTSGDRGSNFVGDLSATEAGVAGSDAGSGSGGGECINRGYGRPDLFYNYYTQGNCNTANAQMYLSPLPVPPNVGHTFYTYQPFYPHHMLYWHKDRYHRYYDNGRGMNRTRALYYAPPIHTAVSNFYWNKLRLAR
jgi:hypothetical protein